MKDLKQWKKQLLMMVGLNKDRIMQGLVVLENNLEDTIRYVSDYSMPNVSEKVMKNHFRLY